jgi:hypothetical protein
MSKSEPWFRRDGWTGGRYVIYPVNWKGWATVCGIAWGGLIVAAPPFLSPSAQHGVGAFISFAALGVWLLGGFIFIFVKSGPRE